MDDDELD